MKSFPFTSFFALALLASVASPAAFATVRFEIIADRLNASATPAPVTTLILVVADTQNNGLGFPLPGSIAAGAFLDGADDLILFRGDLNQSMLNTAGALSADTGALSLSGAWGAGDNIYLVWLPALTIASNSLAGGESYGAIALGTTPPDGGTSTPFYVTVDASGVFGTGSDATTSANMTTGAPPEIVVRGSGNDIPDGASTPGTGNLTDFGSTAMTGGSVVQTFTIHNTGTLDLTLGTPTIAGAHASDFVISSSPASPVTEGTSTSFQITFNPSATGLRTATVSFSNNDPDENPFNFSIQGTGLDSAPTDITLSASSIAENGGPAATVGTLSGIDPDPSDTLTFSLVDGSGDNASFSISGTSLRLTAPADFEAKSSYAVVIRATSGLGLSYDEPFTVNVTNVNEAPLFIKGANQTISASITSAQTITPWATGIDDGDSTVTQSLSFNLSVVTGADLFASPPAVNSSGTLSYTPNGTDGVATLSVTLTDDTTINGQAAITTAAQTFTITVTPTGPEVAVTGDSIHISNGDITPSTTDHTDFGSVVLSDGTVTRTFTITNLGDSPLTVGTIEKAGPHADNFSVANGTAETLAASGTKMFQLTFDPSATGLRVATLSFSTNDTNENPFHFSIQGTGTTPEIAVTGNGAGIASGDTTPDPSDHTDFGFTNPSGGTVTRTFTISNPGTAALVIGDIEIDGTDAADFTVGLPPAASVAPSETTTFQVTFDPSALGVRTATLSFATNDDDENPFTFSILGADNITDGDLNGFTNAEEAAIKALRTQYRVGDAVSLNLGFLQLIAPQRLVVTGLPPGVTFNGTTISGVITGELGDTPGEIQKFSGKTKLASVPFHFTVSPYLFTGSFEALILNGPLPVGKAKLVISTPGTYSATLELQGQTARSKKGTFPTASGATQSVEVAFPVLRAFPATTLTFVVPSTSDLLSGSHGDNSLTGFRLAKPGRSTTKPVTVTFANVVPGDRNNTPGGSGYATGTLSSTGLLSLRSFLGDGQSATLSLNLSQTNQAVVFAQPYADKTESFFGGILTIGDLGAPGRGGSTESQTPGLQWRKKANATATSYRNGFGPLAITGRVSRWLPMTSAEGLALSLGLNLREIAVSYTAEPVSTLPLPSRLALRNRFTLVRLLPTNSVAWSGKAVPSNGTFSGTLKLASPAAGTTVAGVLLQDPAFLEQIGAGFVRIPITAPTGQTALPRGSFETAGIRLQNN